MATYVNNLRLKEIATGDESGTWGTSTNTNLELVTDGFSYGTKQMSADANETFTMPDATADATRGFYLKLTSAASLTGTRVVTLGPNTVSKVWLIENSTTGSQIITIKQGSGGSVNIANGSKVMIITDGAGAGAAVFNANPTESATGDVTLTGTQTLTNKTLTSAVLNDSVLGGTTSTASGNMVVSPATQIVEVKGAGSVEGQIKLNCRDNSHGQTLKAQPHSAGITNTNLLPVGGSSTLVSLISTDTLTNKTLTSPTLVTPVLGTPASGNLSSCTADGTDEVGFRNAPAVGTKTGSYTLAVGDVGKYVQCGSSGAIVIPNSVFAEGDVISVFNNTTGDVTITCTITTAYAAGTDSDIATATLATRGVTTILFISATVCVLTGNIA